MMVTLRVRPGFTHGVRKQYQGGDTFTVPEDEAALQLAAFGDKLEEVATENAENAELPDAEAAVEPAAVVDAPEILSAPEVLSAPEAEQATPKRNRKAGTL